MRLGPRKVYAAILGVLAVAGGLTAWFVGGTDALLAVVLLCVVIGAALVMYTMLQIERRLRAHMLWDPILEAHVDRSVRLVMERTDKALRQIENDLGKSISDMEDRIERKLQRPGEQAEALLKAINAGNTRLELDQRRRLEVLGRTNQTMARLFKHSPAEIDALLQVHRRMRMDDPLPLMAGWALSPRGLLQAIDLVSRTEVKLVVECGSGTSTIFLARALQLKGTGRLVSLEHLAEYAQRTQLGLKEHGLSDFGEVRLAPLEEAEVDGTAYEWYALSSIADLRDIDVLIVDGPPADTGKWARYPALPLLRSRLSPSALVLVDDAKRSDERSIVDAWRKTDRFTEVASYTADIAVLEREEPDTRLT